jgi:hypothetical protein
VDRLSKQEKKAIDGNEYEIVSNQSCLLQREGESTLLSSYNLMRSMTQTNAYNAMGQRVDKHEVTREKDPAQKQSGLRHGHHREHAVRVQREGAAVQQHRQFSGEHFNAQRERNRVAAVREPVQREVPVVQLRHARERDEPDRPG